MSPENKSVISSLISHHRSKNFKTSVLKAEVMTFHCGPLAAELDIYILLHTLCKT